MSRRNRRKLQLANSGRWYLLLAIVFGVVALSSGNNVLYLLESLLLGGLILSGVLSEKAVASVELKWKRRPAIAGSPLQDLIEVKNNSIFPVFCIELGEWLATGTKARHFISMIPGRSSVTVTPEIFYESRGQILWKGTYTATLYPFGFAKKIRLVEDKGNRLIWPEKNKKNSKTNFRSADSPSLALSSKKGLTEGQAQSRRAGANEFSEGEVRPLQFGDDYRDVVWTLSAKRGEPLVRQRQNQQPTSEWILDLRKNPGADFEQEVSRIAEQFYRKGEGSLILVDWTGHRRVEGYRESLNALALVQAKGESQVGAA